MSMLSGWRLTRAGIVFIVGLVVLAGLVFGGVYMVHQRGEQARRDEAVKIAEQNLADQSKVATEATNQGTVKKPDTSSTDSTKKNDDKKTNTSTGALPETGADLRQVVIVAILALSAAFYLASRQAAHSTLDL